MAGTVLKRRRLVNAGRRRRRNMSSRQIRFFGTKRQKSALKNRRRRNVARHGRRRNQGPVTQIEHAAERAIDSIESAAEGAIGTLSHGLTNRGRRRNVGEILTVLPVNPGRRRRRKKVARAANRRRHNRGRVSNRRRNVRRRRNRRSNAVRHHHHRRRNSSPRVVVRYRNRRRNRSYRRRRNQGLGNFLSGDAGKVVATLGGALVTSLITGFLPATFTSGWTGMLATGVVAAVAGQVAGRAMNNRSFGNWMTVGGLLLVGIQLIHQVFPQLALPLTLASGTSGMGLITGSNFYVPQVNLPGSMASFYLPAAIPTAPAVVPAAGMNGLGAYRSFRRLGRFR